MFAEGNSLTLCIRIHTSVVRITLNFCGGAATGFVGGFLVFFGGAYLLGLLV